MATVAAPSPPHTRKAAQDSANNAGQGSKCTTPTIASAAAAAFTQSLARPSTGNSGASFSTMPATRWKISVSQGRAAWAFACAARPQSAISACKRARFLCRRGEVTPPRGHGASSSSTALPPGARSARMLSASATSQSSGSPTLLVAAQCVASNDCATRPRPGTAPRANPKSAATERRASAAKQSCCGTGPSGPAAWASADARGPEASATTFKSPSTTPIATPPTCSAWASPSRPWSAEAAVRLAAKRSNIAAMSQWPANPSSCTRAAKGRRCK
mmetsp:Transcript_110777/g.312324  ORF Transcript_110777/g.312324 Transcript_110777/m.312324 type:complete len:274 (-) Transcript_110777:331-1152(-)